VSVSRLDRSLGDTALEAEHWLRNARVSGLAQGGIILLILLWSLLPGHAHYDPAVFDSLLAGGAALGVLSALLPWRRILDRDGFEGRRFLVLRMGWNLLGTGLLGAGVAITGGDRSPLVVAVVLGQAISVLGSFTIPGIRLTLLALPSLSLLGADLAGSDPLRPADLLLGIGVVGFTAFVLNAVESDLRGLISQLGRVADEEAYRARHDPLSGCANRAGLIERLAKLGDGAIVELAYVDVDGFKEVNDRFGHEAGDELLRVVAERLARAVRPEDLVARLGGDEFAVLVVSPCEPDAIERRLRRICDEPVVLAGRPVALSVSVGVVGGCTTEGSEALLRQADREMYQDKRRRRAERSVAGACG